MLFNKTNPFSSLQLRPVFVFIHGGALLFGSANEEKYFDAAVLASQGDLVVVNFNYRLGRFKERKLELIDSSNLLLKVYSVSFTTAMRSKAILVFGIKDWLYCG